MAKLVDALLSGGSARNGVAVRLCSCARKRTSFLKSFFVLYTIPDDWVVGSGNVGSTAQWKIGLT